MSACPKCKKGRLFLETNIDSFSSTYRCDKCTQLTTVKYTREELERDNSEELARWAKRKSTMQ